MILETKSIEMEKDNEVFEAKIIFSEESDDDEDKVYIRLEFGERVIEMMNYDFFETLNDIRKVLEVDGYQIRCNGAAENVFPSPMILSMGAGRKAYSNVLGKQALKNDLVDIFELNKDYNFVSIHCQQAFHARWIKSL